MPNSIQPNASHQQRPPGDFVEREMMTREVVARIDALKELFQTTVRLNDDRYAQRFRDSQMAVDAALNAAKEAVLKAEMASEKRFEGVNEFRGTLADQQRTLMPRAETEVRLAAIEARVAAIEQASHEQQGKRTGFNQGWLAVAGVITLVMGIVSFILGTMKK